MSQASFRSEKLLPHPQFSVERRRRRSPDPLTALGFMLDTAREQQGFSALAVADSAGLLVAGAGRFADCEELAAHAPIQEHAGLIGTPPDAVEAIDIDGLQVLVAARCGGNKADLSAIASSCLRILRRRALPTCIN